MEKMSPTVVWCEEHSRSSGTYGCLRCACQELSRAISRVDYMVGEPNVMGLSAYDVAPDPEAVVLRVADLVAWAEKAREFVCDVMIGPCEFSSNCREEGLECVPCRARRLYAKFPSNG